MAKVKLGTPADAVLKQLGRPKSRSEVVGEDDPTVIWRYRHVSLHLKYRGNMWRVVKRARPA
jgi:hypothetical protein